MKSPLRFFNHFPRRRGLNRIYPLWFTLAVVLGCFLAECFATDVTIVNGSTVDLTLGIRTSVTQGWGGTDIYVNVPAGQDVHFELKDVTGVSNTGTGGPFGMDAAANATAEQNMSIVVQNEAPASWMNRSVPVHNKPSSGPTLSAGLEIFMKGFIFGIVVQLTGYVLSRFWKVPEDAV